jgi:preprotein translocase subunit SecE
MVELPTFTKPNFGTSPLQFLKEVKAELKKVYWPGQKAVIKMTSMVILVSLIVSLFISGLDFVFTKLNQLLIK